MLNETRMIDGKRYDLWKTCRTMVEAGPTARGARRMGQSVRILRIERHRRGWPKEIYFAVYTRGR